MFILYIYIYNIYIYIYVYIYNIYDDTRNNGWEVSADELKQQFLTELENII